MDDLAGLPLQLNVIGIILLFLWGTTLILEKREGFGLTALWVGCGLIFAGNFMAGFSAGPIFQMFCAVVMPLLGTYGFLGERGYFSRDPIS